MTLSNFRNIDCKGKRILRVSVKRFEDTDPDLSWIGEYTDSSDDWHIIRSAGEFVANLPEDTEIPDRSREYRFFIPYAAGETPGSKLYQEYGKRDFQRMEDYGNGWHMIGIRAECQIAINGVIQEITSGGLWGIESDSDREYLTSVAKDELSNLREQLESLGFSKREISKAIKNAEMEV